MTYSVWVGRLLKMGQKFDSEISQLGVIGRDYLFPNRIDDHLATRRVLHKEVTSLAFVVRNNLIKVAL